MQAEMRGSDVNSEERQREIDDFVARCDRALKNSRELRRRTDRTVEEATTDIKRALAQLRRAYY